MVDLADLGGQAVPRDRVALLRHVRQIRVRASADLRVDIAAQTLLVAGFLVVKL